MPSLRFVAICKKLPQMELQGLNPSAYDEDLLQVPASDLTCVFPTDEKMKRNVLEHSERVNRRVDARLLGNAQAEHVLLEHILVISVVFCPGKH